MKGLKPIRTVKDLMEYLAACPPNAEISLMPEDGEGYLIGGVLEFSAQSPQEVWILFDEFSVADGSDRGDWSGDPTEAGVERAGDMGTISDAEALPSVCNSVCAAEKPDVVLVRGKMRSA